MIVPRPSVERTATPSALVLVAFLAIVVRLLVERVLLDTPIPRALLDASRGWITPDLLAGAGTLLLVVGLGIFLVGRLRPVDVGWRWSDAIPALITTAALWLLLQAALALVSFAGGDAPALAPGWELRGAGGTLALLTGQLLGAALASETVYRGFFLPQIHARLDGLDPPLRLPAAVLLSQALFALSRSSVRLVGVSPPGPPLTGLLSLLGLGCLLALVVLVTGNLLIAVGVHALIETPTAVVTASPVATGTTLLLLLVLLLALWRPLLAGRAPGAAAS